MKNITLINIFYCCIFLLACEDKTVILPLENSEVKIETIAYPTKEPFVEIKDKGLEAHLVLKGLDTDNQVNGKTALIDVEKITVLYFDFIHKSREEKMKVDFLSQKYDLELSREYDENTGYNNRLVIKSINDLKNFRNLISLEASDLLSMETFIIDFENNISAIKVPKNAKFLNVDSCKKLQSLEFVNMNVPIKADLTNISSLHALYISGDLSNLQFEKNLGLKVLNITNSSVKNLNLHGCSNLSELNISNTTKLSNLTFSPKTYRLSLNNTALESIDALSINPTYVKIENNKILAKINLGNASSIYSGISRNNPSLAEILLHQSIKVDTTAYHAHASGPDSKLWQKDPWTNWVVKK